MTQGVVLVSSDNARHIPRSPRRSLLLPPRVLEKLRRYARVAWTLLSIFVVESLVFGISVLPAAVFWEWHLTWSIPRPWMRVVVLAMALVPTYLLFAGLLMLLSALAMRLTGWRAPAGMELRIRDLEWPLLDWVRYAASIHVVRVLAGSFLRASPAWTVYLRLNGARMGPGVFVNTLAMTDHNLLEFGEGTVIGSDVHMSGHTVEHGVVRTAPVRLGRNVTIGVGSVVMPGVQIGDDCLVGALSFVPKHTKLEPAARYAGTPVRRLAEVNHDE